MIMTSPIEGAWQFVSDSQDGIMVFSDSYYSVVISAKNRSKLKSENPTEAEAAEVFRTLTTAAGPYKLVGTTLVCGRIANKNPNWTGVDASFEITLDGARLTLQGGANATVWKKVE
jgi:hypothetical protein